MFKKIMITVVFVGLLAVLVLGGINRTLAKSESEPANYVKASRDDSHDDSTPQGRGQGQGNSQNVNESFERKGLADVTIEEPVVHEENPNNGQGRSETQGSRGFRGGSK